MIIIKGKSVFGGIAMGNIVTLEKSSNKVKRYKTEDTLSEIKRLNKACDFAKEQLRTLYTNACSSVGEINADIFNIHQMMIDDSDFRDSIENIINTENVNAEYALAVAGDNFSNMFSSMDDEYMKERANDVNDITNRILAALSDKKISSVHFNKSIIFADDLLPSQTVQLDKSKILAFITKKGSVNSHTAILARTMGIPAIVGVGEISYDLESRFAIVDGFSGNVYIDPDEETIKLMLEQKEQDERNKELLMTFKNKESISKDGKKVNIFANIGNLKDVGEVLTNDADGIGLFRSEFLFLESDDFPTEAEQFSIYKTVAQNMGGKPVIIRTLDIGADKNVDYFKLEKEENPALGFRAIRLCLEKKEIFKNQLRAIMRASAYGNISIMIPMIVCVDEIREVKYLINEISKEFDDNNVLYNKNMEVGIMIETPAAAIIADELSKEVDFFSIGTNDLTQYTIACDRQNPKLDYLYEKAIKSVLMLINHVIKVAKNNGIWVGVCGEMAGEEKFSRLFLKMGVDELSVSSSKVLGVRKILSETDISKNIDNLSDELEF